MRPGPQQVAKRIKMRFEEDQLPGESFWGTNVGECGRFCFVLQTSIHKQQEWVEGYPQIHRLILAGKAGLGFKRIPDHQRGVRC